MNPAADKAPVQVALVTGASRGIGRAIALTLAQRGFKVIGTATSESGAAAISDALAAYGGRGLALDVTPRSTPRSTASSSKKVVCTCSSTTPASPATCWRCG